MQAQITYLIPQARRAPGASGGKPQMEDEDYDRDVITKMTKNYFRNLATQIVTGKDPEKHEKYEKKQKGNRQRSRRAVVSVLYLLGSYHCFMRMSR